MANKVKLESRFRAAKAGARETVQFARDLALSEGKAKANERLASQSMRRGYEELGHSLRVEKETLGFQSGRIFVETTSDKWGDDPFWARFFEYGTVRIPAMPFMRPAHRQMRKVFTTAMAADFDGFVRRKARL